MGPSDSSTSSSLGSTVLIIIVIVISIIVAALLLRLFLRLFPSSSSVAPTTILVSSDSSTAPAPADSDSSPAAVAEEKKSALIESLPIIKFGSPLAALSKSSPDCAVCLRPFSQNEDLHLLPSCFHTFHSRCVKTWIQTSASCPLCRALVTFPLPPLPPAPPASSGRFSIDVDRRTSEEGGRNSSLPPPMASPALRLTFPIGSSVDPSFEEDVESALSGIQKRSDTGKAVSRGLSSPREEIAGEAGGGSRSCLRDCVDRIVSSRSSSLSRSASFRFSDRWIYHHEDNGHGGGERYLVDWEGNARREETENDWLYTVYTWITGQ